MANLPNLPHNEGASEKNISHDSSKIVNLDRVRHVMTAPPPPQIIEGIGRLFSPEHMRQPVPKESRPRAIAGPIIWEGDFLTISGQSGAGKSAILTMLAAHCTEPGRCFMGHPALRNDMTRPLKVGYLDFEMDEQTMRERSSGYWGAVQYMDTWADLTEEEIDEVTAQDEEVLYQKILYKTMKMGILDVLIVDSYACLVKSTTDRRHFKPVLSKIKRLQKWVEKKTGRRLTIILISHNRQGDKGEEANAEMAHGDTHFTNFLDVVLNVRHSRNPNQSYMVMTKTSRNREGMYSGAREQGDEQCLVFTRHKLPENEHGEQYGLTLTHEVTFERDYIGGRGKGATGEGRNEQAVRIAQWMNKKYHKDKNASFTPSAIAADVKRGKVDIGAAQSTIAEKTLIAMADEIREHLNVAVRSRLDSSWR